MSNLRTRTLCGGVRVPVRNDPLNERDNVLHVLGDS